MSLIFYNKTSGRKRILTEEQLGNLVEKIVKGDRRAVARAITIVESDPDAGLRVLEKLPKPTKQSPVIGVTGPPGVGKSTLIGRVVKELITSGNRIGVLAIDPTSPFTGGAVLGDRLRMLELSLMEQVFIRSMASKEGTGGIADATEAAARILEASGMDFIIIETVGAGQTDIEIAHVADFVMLVTMPELGDEIQSLKAGILEIADIVVVNKADLPTADNTVRMLRNTLQSDIKIIKTSATTGEGIKEITNILTDLKRGIGVKDQAKRRKRVADALSQAIAKNLAKTLQQEQNQLILDTIEKIIAHQKTVKTAAQEITQQIIKKIQIK
ncbi:MAG TPA: methylmalonyl Co-A mutase-associated GTPase MeaB [Candidatus Caldiarchaeum subterraneum]|uniref:Methylmalonyl Co-A mutase-associated GTPase MeaB n=1 Tax=Caldiarchaeum subterraneum TaxID=311458 RepID=A0A833EC14_CALS0|nr:methylmalonyl Co-A mutase-associated GTPase MeaB [Candidatus Caldarchaeum subterraneum]